MTLIRNLFSSLITFFLVPAIFIFIFLSSTTAVFLNTEKFNSVLKQSNVYSQIGSSVVPYLVSQNISENSETKKITENVFKQISLDKSHQLQNDIEKIVVSVHKYLTTDEKSFETKIDLTSYHQIVGENIVSQLTNQYKNLPFCTSAQLKEITNTDFPVCQKKNLDISAILKSSSLDETITQLLPNSLIVTEKGVTTEPKINLTNNPSNSLQKTADSNNQEVNLSQSKKAISTVRQGQDLLFIAIIILTLILVISRLTHYSDSLFWTASVLFSACILPLILSFAVVYFLKPEAIQKALQQILGQEFNTSNPMLTVLTSTSFTFIKLILEQVKLTSIILIVLAVTFFVISKLLDYRKTRKVTLDATSNKVT